MRILFRKACIGNQTYANLKVHTFIDITHRITSIVLYYNLFTPILVSVVGRTPTLGAPSVEVDC